MKKFRRHFRIYFVDDDMTYIIDISFSDIKKSGRTQIHLIDDCATITSGNIIKPKRNKKGKNNG